MQLIFGSQYLILGRDSDVVDIHTTLRDRATGLAETLHQFSIHHQLGDQRSRTTCCHRQLAHCGTKGRGIKSDQIASAEERLGGVDRALRCGFTVHERGDLKRELLLRSAAERLLRDLALEGRLDAGLLN